MTLKRIWFGIGLMVFLLILCLCSSFLMERICLSQSQALDHAAAAASDGDWLTARSLTAQAKQEWDRRQLLFAALYDHAPIDEIDGLFAQLEVYSDARKGASFESTCVYLARQLESLGRSHSFNFSNFL